LNKQKPKVFQSFFHMVQIRLTLLFISFESSKVVGTAAFLSSKLGRLLYVWPHLSMEDCQFSVASLSAAFPPFSSANWICHRFQ